MIFPPLIHQDPRFTRTRKDNNYDDPICRIRLRRSPDVPGPTGREDNKTETTTIRLAGDDDLVDRRAVLP